ncbi:hypothetical protein GIB67_018498 [Kingdonia uniflora]|uniref:Uncharacterized protein n=1 Tax=Kingdonia uniflora TaxID=39325 RepID=A0A7J7LW50_9MAGN|nr:hypothetical protein GIB67_018498 [Kingdonia uniflora]
MEIFKRAISATLALLLLTKMCQGLPPETKALCNYTITIETMCTKGADTSNKISLRFGDMKFNDVLIHHVNSKHMRQVDPLEPAVYLDEAPKKPFQECTVDEFQVTGLCVEEPICYMYLKLNGDDDWRPGVADVRMSQASHLSSTDFYFRRYLPRNVWYGSDMCRGEVTPFGIKQERKVFSEKAILKSSP